MGTNSYTGPTTIGSGGTVIADGAASMGTGAALVVNGGTLDLDGFSQSVAGLSGSGGAITNNGIGSPATLTVTGGSGSYAGVLKDGSSQIGLSVTGGSVNLTSATSHTYTGNTSISGGASLTIANINSPTAVTDDGTLAAAGTAGTLLVDQGGSLTPGPTVASGNTGTLNASSLTIGSGGGSLNFLANSASAIDQLLLSGSATLNGPLTVNATISDTLPGGTYTLLSSSGLILNSNTVSGNVTIAGGGGSSTRTVGSIQKTPSLIQLVVSGAAANLVWTDGSKSTDWEANQADANWLRTDSGTGGLSNEFYNGDNVTFDSTHNTDTPPNYTVDLTSTVQPGSVLFTNGSSTNYTLNGGGISGATGLTVNSSDGTGTVTLNNTNTYGGNTTVTAGSLVIGNGGSVAGGTFTLAGGASATVDSGGSLNSTTLNISGTFTEAGSVGGTTMNIASLAVANVISGGNLSTPTVNINGGSLTVQSGGTLASTALAVASGASLSVQSGSSVSNNPSLANNGSVTFGSDENIGALSGATASAVITETGTLTVAGSGTYAGSIVDGNGAGSANLTLASGTLVLTGTNGYSGSTTINSGATLQVDAGLNTGSLNSATSISDSGTLIYDRADNPMIANTLSGSGAFRQLGGGTLTLTGANSGFGGAIQVYNGTVVQGATNPNTLGSGGGGVVIGTPGSATATTPVGTLMLDGSITTTSVASISSTSSSLTASPTPNTIVIPAGVTLTDNGAFTVGLAQTVYTTLAATGGGSLAVNGTVTVGATNGTDIADFSALNNVAINNGTINIGDATPAVGTLNLANTTVGGMAPVNTINTGTINLSTTNTATPAAASILTLGSGTNTISASTINLGTGRGAGIIQFAAGAPSSATLILTGTPTINMALASTNGTQTSTPAAMNLAGFNVNVQAGTITMADETANLAGGPAASITFDTGTFSAGSVMMAADTGGSSTTGPTASIAIGGPTANSAATGVFTSNNIVLGDFTNTNAFSVASATATATLTLNGGVADVQGSITNNSTAGTTDSTLNLAGGTLNMNNNSIGGGSGVNSGNGPITTNFQSGTLENVGEINGGTTGLVKTGNGTLTVADNGGNHNNYSGGTTVGGGLLIVATPTALGQGGLTINTGAAQLQPTLGGPLVLPSLSIASGGLLDVTNNSMIVNNGNLASITSNIAKGYNGGPWNGTTGITSSTAAGTHNTAVGVELNSNGSTALLSTFEGQGVTSTDVLVKYTYFGDANLDGVVNGSDYTLIDNGFNNNLTGWHNGDFNYDGIVNGDDYTLIDNAFNTQGAPIAAVPGFGELSRAAEMIAINTSQVAGGSSSGVPEPASLGLLGAGAVALLGRRRRRLGK